VFKAAARMLPLVVAALALSLPAAAASAAASAPEGASALVDIYSCGARDCSTGNNNVCQVIIAYLPTNGTCTWNGGAYCFLAVPDGAGAGAGGAGGGTLTVTGFRWNAGLGCACGAAPAWGIVSGLAVDGVAGCMPVNGGTAGGAYALPGGQRRVGA